MDESKNLLFYAQNMQSVVNNVWVSTGCELESPAGQLKIINSLSDETLNQDPMWRCYTPSTLKNQAEFSMVSSCILALTPVTTNRLLGVWLLEMSFSVLSLFFEKENEECSCKRVSMHHFASWYKADRHMTTYPLSQIFSSAIFGENPRCHYSHGIVGIVITVSLVFCNICFYLEKEKLQLSIGTSMWCSCWTNN